MSEKGEKSEKRPTQKISGRVHAARFQLWEQWNMGDDLFFSFFF